MRNLKNPQKNSKTLNRTLIFRVHLLGFRSYNKNSTLWLCKLCKKNFCGQYKSFLHQLSKASISPWRRKTCKINLTWQQNSKLEEKKRRHETKKDNKWQNAWPRNLLLFIFLLYLISLESWIQPTDARHNWNRKEPLAKEDGKI